MDQLKSDTSCKWNDIMKRRGYIWLFLKIIMDLFSSIEDDK